MKEAEQSIYYMRDNHTFKKLSEDVSAALIEIEHEFNEGYTYGSLCSKRDGFPMVNASGSKNRMAFFAECKSVLEKWLPKAAPPQRTWVGLTDEEIDGCDWGQSERDYAKAIEAKLKEKNT